MKAFLALLAVAFLTGCGSTGTFSYDGKTMNVTLKLPEKQGLAK